MFLFKSLGWRWLENWAIPLVTLGQSVQGPISGFDEVARDDEGVGQSHVAADPPNGLVRETTGADHLHGGETRCGRGQGEGSG